MASKSFRRWAIAVAGAAAVGSLASYVLWRRSLGETVAERVANTFEPSAPRFEWRSIDRRHWQALAKEPAEDREVTDARENNRGPCGPGMIHVHGRYKLDPRGYDASLAFEDLQNEACTDWISRDFPARCRTFDREKWLALSKPLPTRSMSYCIDRFEYPNVMGENPMIVVTWNEAQKKCAGDRKRLCTESEWTFACEGEEAVPYPYGYERDPEACVVDQPWRAFDEKGLAQRDSEGAQRELDRLWQGRPSGSRPRCKSPFGVYDTTGNVDEWTQSVRKDGLRSILKGGYWGPVRARCRPSTRAHGEDFIAYQQSFRCCGDAPDAPTSPAPAATGVASAAEPSPAPSASAGATASSAPSAASAPTSAPGTSAPALAISAPRPAASGAAPTEDTEEAELLDELEALAKRRTGLACRGTISSSTSMQAEALALAPLALSAAALLRRRRKRPSAAE